MRSNGARTGRLELTWTNKDQVLISTGEGRYDYEWVDPSDLRAREVRLLHQVGTVSAPDGRPEGSALPEPTHDNLLITGDALHVLDALAKTPELAARYVGKVKLVYIDPPFNTGQAFEHYEDNLEHSIWLTMLRDRIRQIRPLLSPDASVWVHLDDAEVHRMRSVMDETLGAGNFVATVIWKKLHARNNSAQHFSTDHDYLLVYAKDISKFRVDRFERTAASDGDFWNPDNDPRGDWRRSDLTASHAYADGLYTVTGPHGDQFSPATRGNRWWSCSQATFDALVADNRVWWGRTGRSFPFRKRFRSELAGLVPTTVWSNEDVGDNRQAKTEVKAVVPSATIPFATPKPERLLQRIIHLTTSPGDIVLDFYAGSGTTAAVAHKMGRRWVTCDLSDTTVSTYTRPRLAAVVQGTDDGGISTTVAYEPASPLPDGVTAADARSFTRLLAKFAAAADTSEDAADDPESAPTDATLARALRQLRVAASTRKVTNRTWYGGGGFTHLRVGPSMFETVDGIVYLARWARGGDLARAVAAQFSFQFDDARYPFTGRKGRKLLAVVDGSATTEVVRHVQGELGDGEKVAIYATSIDPAAREALAAGCTLEKVPQAILDAYSASARRRRPVDWVAELDSNAQGASVDGSVR